MFLATAASAQQQAPISPSQQPAAPSVPPPQPSQIDTQGSYKIRTQVSLVVLHVSVLNDRSAFVPGLKEEDFHVYEDKVEQKLSVFKQEDVPVSFGLVVDNSGSMRDKRPQVNAAALTFVKTSNPQDEGFVVNFNDDYYLDTEHDFTSDINEMKAALERIDARGSTALYDAVIGSLDHLKKGKRDKKVILVVTDGEDNASRHTLENAVEQAQRSNAVIYAVGLFSDDDMKHDHRAMKKARRALSELAEATGGIAFFPENVGDTQAICTQIAHDIRNQYTLAYYPTNTAHDGTFRQVHVEVTPPRGTGKLSVRTRTGYYAPRARASGN
ncbi:MAG TPA: VWA domain-containing protein [Candidatus Dormibacteraeota bacterium]|nr:VWA domain-containing protein [Candidatus Dormibacteraeota bacterium]